MNCPPSEITLGIVRIIYWFLVAILALVLVILGRTALFASRQIQPKPVQLPNIGADEVVELLSSAVRIPTVSYEAGMLSDTSAFDSFAVFLEDAFPRAHNVLQRDSTAAPSLLYTWKGSDPSLQPIVLTGHFDVVPADAADWTHPPFGGRVEGGYVWGRGTLDDKQAVISILSAVEHLIASGFVPSRTVHLAFGHDEEVGGESGAARMARLLHEKGIAPHFVLDEGLPITTAIISGIDRPVALIAVAEKGAATVELTSRAGSGHSSIPPARTAIGTLARAVVRLEEEPMPGRLQGVARSMFESLGPEMSMPSRIAFANLWLSRPYVERQLAASPATNALLRTTTAPTVIEGGSKQNVLPDEATALINFRILPGDSLEGLIDHIRRTVNDSTVEVRILPGAAEATAVSPTDGPVFRAIQESIVQVFSDAVVAPALMIARSDARHYEILTPNVYRFSPSLLARDEVGRIHGIDERISRENLVQTVQFYHRLIENTAGGG